MKCVNVMIFILAMLMNGLNKELNVNTLPGITKEWGILIAPATWAYAIWGVIYMLLIVFVIYQAIPRI